MRALNLYTLTRIKDNETFSALENAFSARPWHKRFSAHETASVCELTDRLADCFLETVNHSENPAPWSDWISFFDGFYFSYTIEHISKEFDLLKISEDGNCVLNIELKSESIDEERIRKQLDQNRYYLSHVSRTILSYSYVMEDNTLYCLNEHGFLRKCSMAELAEALQRPALQTFVKDKIESFFRAQDYLISPVRDPDKLLTGRYFLTNQQSEFRRQILEALSLAEEDARSEEGRADGREAAEKAPVISLTGSAGTGKTLLLFDLAIRISQKRKVLFVHGGPLREGHRIIDQRLHKVDVFSGTEEACEMTGGKPVFPDYACILIDEANRFDAGKLGSLLQEAVKEGVPCVLAYDPHNILGPIPMMDEAEAMISRYETLSLEFSGNIRINRPIFAFLRALFHQKDLSGDVDYSCVDVVYAADREEENRLIGHYLVRGYELIRASSESFHSGEIISREFEKVLMVLDRHFTYDESMHLCADKDRGASILSLYEGLSRAREKLCLLITDNERLFRQILAIRTGREDGASAEIQA